MSNQEDFGTVETSAMTVWDPAVGTLEESFSSIMTDLGFPGEDEYAEFVEFVLRVAESASDLLERGQVVEATINVRVVEPFADFAKRHEPPAPGRGAEA